MRSDDSILHVEYYIYQLLFSPPISIVGMNEWSDPFKKDKS